MNALLWLLVQKLVFSQDTCTYLEEVLDSFRVITVGFSADTLNFLDLTSFARCLNVFEVDL